MPCSNAAKTQNPLKFVGMPRSFYRWTMPNRRFNQNILPSVVLLLQCHCQNRHRGKLQNLSPLSVLLESSPNFFYNTQETQKQNNDGPEFWKSNFVIIENFFEILKKPSHGPCAADLDHYDRGQTRPCFVSNFRQNRSTLKGRSVGQTDRHRHKLGWK